MARGGVSTWLEAWPVFAPDFPSKRTGVFSDFARCASRSCKDFITFSTPATSSGVCANFKANSRISYAVFCLKKKKYPAKAAIPSEGNKQDIINQAESQGQVRMLRSIDFNAPETLGE